MMRTRTFFGVALAAACTIAASPAAGQAGLLLRARNAAGADRLAADSAGGLVLRGAVGNGTLPAAGAGTRMMWYPGKAAFRAGQVTGTAWDDANVGVGSAAVGVDAQAAGTGAVALGAGATAPGAHAFAAGKTASAGGDYSVALGYGASSAGQHSLVFGMGAAAPGSYSVALGKSATASGNFAAALGENAKATGNNSVAIGTDVSTGGFGGAIILGDGSALVPLNASANNQFTVRASGGYRLFSSAQLSTGVTLSSGGGSWNSISDRNRKEGFLAVDGEAVLARIRALPVSTWRYRSEEDRAVRHIGPMAQDWAAAFGLSPDTTTINTGDFDGVNLAAAQALAARTDRLGEADARHDARLRALEAENRALRARLERLEALLDARPATEP
ncbi:MAG TPA: tail fiber domain-containing protein [Longimicrobium sp.]|jgi:hypothetical protein|uniref:tail fiber domain-containing protein n=1 Tax=Longimicrobium sp. TaxID=2029185 RepID=UPI002EDA4326